MFGGCCCAHDDDATEALPEASHSPDVEEPKAMLRITNDFLLPEQSFTSFKESSRGEHVSARSLGSDADYMGTSSSLSQSMSSSAQMPMQSSVGLPAATEESQQDVAREAVFSDESQQDYAQEAASTEKDVAQYGPGDFSRLLRLGKLFEAYALLETYRDELDPKCVKWLEEVMPLLLKATEYVPEEFKETQAAAAGSKWSSVECDTDCKVDVLRHGDTIKFRTVMELPTSMEHVLAINYEIDLNSQWMPFSPTVKPTHSKSSASLLVHMCFKIPVLPGHREMYTYRVCVDCLTPSELSKRRGLPRGLMFVDVSPDCWKSGGSYLGEFVIPPRERWTSRDKAQMQVAFWEPLTPSSSRLTLFGEIVFAVPKMLVPDSTLQWLVKQITRASRKNLHGLFKDMVRYGYQTRIDKSDNMMYQTLRQEASDFFTQT